MQDATPPRVLIVVATLGQRPALLEETLASIRSQSVQADIAIVAPTSATDVQHAATRYGAALLADPGGLAAAINLGAAWGANRYEYVNWLNDDDLLEAGSLAATTHALDANPRAVVAYGACRYINENGVQLWVNRAGPWAVRMLSWGPDLIPQPGMLVRMSAWHEVGGLNENYRLAFDLDLLLRLKKVGAFIDVNQVVSSFRWHGDSLTVDNRSINLAESERAKRTAMNPFAQRFAGVWQPLVRVPIRIAAWEMQRRAVKRSRSVI